MYISKAVTVRQKTAKDGNAYKEGITKNQN